MQIEKCPKCENPIKFYTKGKCLVDFSLEKANQTIICKTCKREIAFSVKKL